MKKVFENILLVGLICGFVFLIRDYPQYARLILLATIVSPFTFLIFRKSIVRRFREAGENKPYYFLAQTFNIVLMLGCFNLNFFIPLIFLPFEIFKTVYLYKVVR